MAAEPKAIGPNERPRDAAGLMAAYGIGFVPLVERDGTLVGVVTDRDLVVRALAGTDVNLADVRIGDIATTRGLITISPDATVSEAGELMRAARVKRLPVVRGDVLVGVISLGDLAHASGSSREVGEVVQDIFQPSAAIGRNESA